MKLKRFWAKINQHKSASVLSNMSSLVCKRKNLKALFGRSVFAIFPPFRKENYETVFITNSAGTKHARLHRNEVDKQQFRSYTAGNLDPIV